ncbi:uncharacterized protein BROUX77_005154 [Berkeleyomyces rouxiae]|uniref:uncharacterized protein n=1 Tax=Berkeleyomyces rouxiae TaxID=2035830 RepID=UPI003B7E712B
MPSEPFETTQNLSHTATLPQHHLVHQDGRCRPTSDPLSSASDSGLDFGSGSESDSGAVLPLKHIDEDQDYDELEAVFQGYLCGIEKRSSTQHTNGNNHNLAGHDRTPGARIAQYEKLAVSQIPKGAKSTKTRAKEPEVLVDSESVKLEELPNEILTLIVSHLDADSQTAIVLVSRRFNDLMSAQDAWRLGFSRFFPGRNSLVRSYRWIRNTDDSRSTIPHFSRLTALAAWRTEYMLRTRLLRNLMRGRPGGGAHSLESSSRSKGSNKRSNAILTFNTKLPWLVTNLHAVFENGNKPPKSIHGVRRFGAASVADPSTGKIGRWGLENFVSLHTSNILPSIVPYGLGEDYAAAPNVMDVSESFGHIVGEGYPRGRPFHRSRMDSATRHLKTHMDDLDLSFPLDLPRVPHSTQGISAVWIAKKPDILPVTESMIGMITGSTLGIVTAYSVGGKSLTTGVHFSSGDMTARWAVCPGVAIIAIKIDDHYSVQRKSAGRVWAVVLNALGEVYYLKHSPIPKAQHNKNHRLVGAWHSGLSVKWHLVEKTRRVLRSDTLGASLNEVEKTPPPNLDMSAPEKDRILAARTIESFLSYRPSYFRKLFSNWDMQRRLEVDFANEDGNRRGEIVLVIDCGHGLEKETPVLTRYMRSSASVAGLFAPITAETFQSMGIPDADLWSKSESTVSKFGRITTSAIDMSNYATTTFVDDVNIAVNAVAPGYPDGFTPQSLHEIPGYRGRYVAVGTDIGKVIVWDLRETQISPISPVRVIETESPGITSIALNSLYLVHGGSDGLAQTWDPLGSTLEPLRTINSKTNGRIPRHIHVAEFTSDIEEYSHVGAIYLDPDPTVLRGVISFGSMVRFWTYSSPRKLSKHRRHRAGGDLHGRPLTRRGPSIISYIAAEKAEIGREEERRTREEEYLRKRFGVGAFGDFSEEEALNYAQMISQDSFADEEQRRIMGASLAESPATNSRSDTASSADNTYVAEGVAGSSQQNGSAAELPVTHGTDDVDAEFEEQIQRALRLSLFEASSESLSGTQSSLNSTPASMQVDTEWPTESSHRSSNYHSPLNPPAKNSYTAPITYKVKTSHKKSKGKEQALRQVQFALDVDDVDYALNLSLANDSDGTYTPMNQEDMDLELALRLSMQTDMASDSGPSSYHVADDWPDLTDVK